MSSPITDAINAVNAKAEQDRLVQEAIFDRAQERLQQTLDRLEDAVVYRVLERVGELL